MVTSSKQGILLLDRISGITETFMRDELISLESSRKQKYISDLSRFIVNSRASHSDKNRIMDAINILPTDKIKILLAIIRKEHNVGMKIELSKNIYVTLIENFDKIKEKCFREPVDITFSYNSFLHFITTAFHKGLEIQRNFGLIKGLRVKKRGFNDVFQRYHVVYDSFMDTQLDSICSTIVLNDDVRYLIYSFF